MARSKTAPLAFQLEVEFLDRLSEPVRDGKAKSVSHLIREALENFDFAHVLVVHPAQLQISVRLPAGLRQTLRRTARARHTSIGQLVRAAVEAHLPRFEAQAAGQLEMPIVEPPAAGRTGVRAAGRRPRRRRPRGAARGLHRKRGAMTKKRKG